MIRVCTIWHFLCTFSRHFPTVRPPSLNFRVITAITNSEIFTSFIPKITKALISCTSMQADKGLKVFEFGCLDGIISTTICIRNSETLANLWSCIVQSESDLVGNPEDRLSCHAAHMLLTLPSKHLSGIITPVELFGSVSRRQVRVNFILGHAHMLRF